MAVNVTTPSQQKYLEKRDCLLKVCVKIQYAWVLMHGRTLNLSIICHTSDGYPGAHSTSNWAEPAHTLCLGSSFACNFSSHSSTAPPGVCQIPCGISWFSIFLQTGSDLCVGLCGWGRGSRLALKSTAVNLSWCLMQQLKRGRYRE